MGDFTLLNKNTLKSQLKSFELFIVIDEFFGTTIHSTIPDELGYFGVAYKRDNNNLLGINWRRNEADQFEISTEFVEDRFKMHDKTDALIRGKFSNLYNQLKSYWEPEIK